jgi:LPS O-antigen subunit length determinant protein (WzzB/FepE family)
MATLAQIANRIRDLAVLKAPKKTGNLKRKLADYNRPSGMIKQSKTNTTRSFEFELDVSPPGAEYGKFWNDPNVSSTVRNGKTPNVPKSINFAQQAINDPQIQKMIDDYISQISDEVANEVGKSIERELKDFI